jgi:hypothetical protein
MLEMNRIQLVQVTLIGVGAVLTLGAVGTATASSGHSDYTMAGTQMSTGVTRTATTAPTTLETPLAAPSITGPAALPREEQGLPG